MKSIICGKFQSKWSNGVIETTARLNVLTGEILFDEMNDGTLDMGCLIKETFISNTGNEYDVCAECHSYIFGRCDC